MKVGTAYQKMRKVEKLIEEHARIKAALTYMERDAVISEPVRGYIDNMKKTLANIENIFDELLK